MECPGRESNPLKTDLQSVTLAALSPGPAEPNRAIPHEGFGGGNSEGGPARRERPPALRARGRASDVVPPASRAAAPDHVVAGALVVVHARGTEPRHPKAGSPRDDEGRTDGGDEERAA